MAGDWSGENDVVLVRVLPRVASPYTAACSDSLNSSQVLDCFLSFVAASLPALSLPFAAAFLHASPSFGGLFSDEVVHTDACDALLALP